MKNRKLRGEIGLHEQSRTEIISRENEQLTLWEGREKIEEVIVRMPKVWGIRKADLGEMLYRDLEDVFYGLHNLAMPNAMANVLNPDEILVKYLAAYRLKRGDRHLKTDFPKRDFVEVVRVMDDEGYSQIGYMAKGCKKRFSYKPLEQLKRLKALSDNVQGAFVDAFFEKYNPSNRQEPENPQAFYDPNCDGASERVYINRIYEILKARQERE